MGVSRIGALARAIGQFFAARPNHVVAVFGAVIILARGTMLIIDLDARYHAAIAAAEQSARSFAEVLAEHTARTFEAVDRTLGQAELIRRNVEAGRYATTEAVQQDLRRLQQTSPLLIALNWTNAVGDIEAHSSAGGPPRRNIADRLHFTVQRDNPSTGLFVAPPFHSAATGTWITAASRRLQSTGSAPARRPSSAKMDGIIR